MVDQTSSAWTAVLLQKSLSEGDSGPRLWLDLHDRRGETGTVQIVRPGVGWQFNPQASVWLGYAWIPTWPDEGDATFEHRIWEQAFLSKKLGDSWSFTLRPRLEQRLRFDQDGMGHRLRVMGRAAYHLGGPVSVVVWDEAFIQFNTNDWITAKGFDQNRLFIGPALTGFEGMRVEVGYFNQLVPRPDLLTLNHTVMVNLFLNL